jgi:hypothetical protein
MSIEASVENLPVKMSSARRKEASFTDENNSGIVSRGKIMEICYKHMNGRTRENE